jgi:hypothetical protein
MKQYLLYINSISINENNLIISDNKYNIILSIKNGSIDIDIMNELNENIGIKNININDMIIVYYKESIEKNIKPIKIIKQYNYNFNNETSDSENNMEYL